LTRPLKLVHPPPQPAKPAFPGDDAALVLGFRRGDPGARAALYDRYADHVHRVLYRVLGFDRDLADLHHDVFVRALGSIARLEDPSALKAWLTSIAVHVARSAIARRKRRSWLWFLPGEDLPEVEAGAASGEVLDALGATYAILATLPAEERIAFALRFIDGMELTEVAAACGTSLATIKRRLARAGDSFAEQARRHPALQTWVEGGTRWASPSSP
jgi:RNA polymerase sigma-70 factor (ECF subfamily)